MKYLLRQLLAYLVVKTIPAEVDYICLRYREMSRCETSCDLDALRLSKTQDFHNHKHIPIIPCLMTLTKLSKVSSENCA